MTTVEIRYLSVFEQRSDALSARIKFHESNSDLIVQEAWALSRMFQSETVSTGASSFTEWFSARTGIPAGSVDWYVRQGQALSAGITAPTRRALHTAGGMVNNGMPAEQVQAAVDAGEVQYVAQAQRNAGMVRVPVPLDTHRRLRAITEAVEHGLGISLPETAALCIEFVSENAQDFGAWLRRRGGA